MKKTRDTIGETPFAFSWISAGLGALCGAAFVGFLTTPRTLPQPAPIRSICDATPAPASAEELAQLGAMLSVLAEVNDRHATNVSALTDIAALHAENAADMLDRCVLSVPRRDRLIVTRSASKPTAAGRN